MNETFMVSSLVVLAMIVCIGLMGIQNVTNALTALSSECKPPHEQLG